MISSPSTRVRMRRTTLVRVPIYVFGTSGPGTRAYLLIPKTTAYDAEAIAAMLRIRVFEVKSKFQHSAGRLSNTGRT